MNAFHKKITKDLIVIPLNNKSKSKIKRFKKAEIEYYSVTDKRTKLN